MAGMLPGVEAARRRRIHQSNVSGSDLSPTTFTCTRRSSFCLYASGHEYHLTNSTSSMRNPISHMAVCDESRLGAAAREAKKRLDQRLQPQWMSQNKRTIPSQQRARSLETRPIVQVEKQIEVPKLKKNGSKRLNWLKLNWKSSEQEECPVCLEQFKTPSVETLMELPCGHKFHTNCLVPWLKTNSHCPCCRTRVPS